MSYQVVVRLVRGLNRYEDVLEMNYTGASVLERRERGSLLCRRGRRRHGQFPRRSRPLDVGTLQAQDEWEAA